MNAFTIIIICGALYFMPAFIAGIRHHRNLTALFALNLFLGWTVLGWIGALVWALIKQEAAIDDAIPAPHPSAISTDRQAVGGAEETPFPTIQLAEETPLPTIKMDAEPVQVAIKTESPGEQDWVRQAKAELAASRRK